MYINVRKEYYLESTGFEYSIVLGERRGEFTSITAQLDEFEDKMGAERSDDVTTLRLVHYA
jgi:hypothetical protein